jgi:actin-related protein 2
VGDIELKEIMIADEANPVRSQLEISYPLVEGIVRDWEDMILLWDYCFKKLGVAEDKSNCTVLLTEAALNPIENRRKMGKIMFEKFGFGGVLFEQ